MESTHRRRDGGCVQLLQMTLNHILSNQWGNPGDSSWLTTRLRVCRLTVTQSKRLYLVSWMEKRCSSVMLCRSVGSRLRCVQDAYF